jgi:uncharacterized protein with ParB-like and HNH nuclease domain
MMDQQASVGLRFQETGIAAAIVQQQLVVPVNQRSYAWEEAHVQALFRDLTKAFDSPHKVYFLGTIVLTRGQSSQWEVADGQQRLATTCILIAAIRDYLIELGDDRAATKYESDYLVDYDPRSRESREKLRLNLEDSEYFKKRILGLRALTSET